MDNEVIGWILDAHLCSTQQEILVWIANEAGPVVEHRETWHPTFHVSGNRKDLQNLIDWLWQPELRLRYGIESYAFEMKRTELGSFDMQHLISITLQSCATLRSLAEHIDARGEHFQRRRGGGFAGTRVGDEIGASAGSSRHGGNLRGDAREARTTLGETARTRGVVKNTRRRGVNGRRRRRREETYQR